VVIFCQNKHFDRVSIGNAPYKENNHKAISSSEAQSFLKIDLNDSDCESGVKLRIND
jgi:hypothetical protein